MTFFHPWAFGFAGLAPVIVALYLLKVRRRPVAVSTLMFWQRVLEEKQHRALFQRLRQWLSLLLHLLIFALVLLALSRPTLDHTVHEGSSTVLLVDTRARMQAREADGETRLAKALRAAETYARQAAPSRQMALATTEPHAGVRLGFTGDEKALREALEKCEATDAGGALREALALLSDLLAARAGEKQVLFFTDQAEPDLAVVGAKLETIPVGTARDNVAITRFASRALPASPETFEVLLEVTNFSATAYQGQVEVKEDGQLQDVHPIALGAGEKKAITFPALSKGAGRGPTSEGKLVAHLSTADALPLDDTAYATLPRSAPRKVLLVTRGNWFLEKLLAADLRLRLELLLPEDYQPSQASQFDCVILDDLPEATHSLPANGNFLYLKQSPFVTGGPALEQPLITDVDAQSPALRLANLDHITLTHAVPLALPKEPGDWHFETPLRFDEQPLFITGERHTNHGTQRVAALAFSTLDSDLPLRVAFPLMVASTLHWLSGEAALEAPEQKAGDTLEGKILSSPPLAKGSPSSPSMLLHNGFYQVQREGGAAWVTVNTFDPAESNLRPVLPTPPLSSAPRAVVSRHAPFSPSGWPLWPSLALAAALLCTGEWWLFHRRQTE